MKERFIGKTVVEHRREFIGISPYGKQIGIFLDQTKCQKRPQTKKPIFLDLESEKSGSQIIFLEHVEKDMKFAHEISVQNGSYTFPNELTRFPYEAKEIWGKIQKHCKNAVII